MMGDAYPENTMGRFINPVAAILLVGLWGSAGSAMEVEKWVTSWGCSIQGPYPVGTAPIQPQLRFALPGPDFKAHDQTFRMTVRPDLWSKIIRLRFSNWASTKPLTLDGVFVGAQERGAAIVHGTNHAVSFGGQNAVTLPPGQVVWSDPIRLEFVTEAAALYSHKLLVSFHVAGRSGEISWQSEALTTSYLSTPGSGSLGSQESGLNFSESTTSWFLLDAIDALVSFDTRLIVALGDSITNGTGSTLNGDDRWTDALATRLHARYGNKVGVVNAGIGGNQVLGPVVYSKESPFPGGPAALQRISRDVLSLSGVSTVIWSQGINDIAAGSAAPSELFAGIESGVAILRTNLPTARIVGGTLTSALGSLGEHGTVEVNTRRRMINELIRTARFFDYVIDFDKATTDQTTGALKVGFGLLESGGVVGDRLHLSRAGYLAMGKVIDLDLLMRKN
jgi:lysophospholipase L1-like esterase